MSEKLKTNLKIGKKDSPDKVKNTRRKEKGEQEESPEKKGNK